ncbi:LamG domain-containing protein [Rariglobus hedericola]|nr:LamG domain-containing protein [Rariglobus hedericola]
MNYLQKPSRNFLRSALLAAGLALLTTSLSAADPEQALVAKWTFKNGSLTSVPGNIALSSSRPFTPKSQKGAITLSDRQYLIASALNSEKFPALTSGVTIWARIRMDALPTDYEINLLGLQDTPDTGDWSNMVFSLLYRPVGGDVTQAGFSFLSRTSNGTQLGVGSSRFQPAPVGEFIDVALVFDPAFNAASMWVDGVLVTSRHHDALALPRFGGLGIGQLKSPGSLMGVTTYDEIRVYSRALSEKELKALKPTQD